MIKRLYVVIVGNSDQDEVNMSMHGTPVYNRDGLVRMLRTMIADRIADDDDELDVSNVADNLDTTDELTTNMYDGYGQTMYKIFEI